MPDPTPDVVASPGPPPPQPTPDSTPTQSIPTQPTNAQAPLPATSTGGGATSGPGVNEPMPPGSWGSRVYHGILGALGGTNSTEITAYDPNTGKAVVSGQKLQPGQQWKNIIAGALAGLSAGGQIRGPGTAMQRFGAGYQGGQQQRVQQENRQQALSQQEFENQQKAAMSNAQRSIMALQLARGTFDLGRAQVDATATDMERENRVRQMVMEGGPGSVELGHYGSADEAQQAFKNDPTLHEAMAHGQILTVPHVGTNGKIDGIQAFKVTADYAHMTTKEDQEVSYNAKDPKTGNIVQKTFTLPAGTPLDTALKYEMGAATQEVADKYKERELDIQDRKAKAEAAMQKEEGFKDYYEGVMARAKSQQISMVATPEGQTMIDAIGKGQMGANPRGMLLLLTKNPELLDAVVQKYPDFNVSKIEAYANAYKDFTSGKTSTQMTAGGTVLKHMQELSQLNTVAALNPMSRAHSAYEAKANQVAHELANFYGDTTVSGIDSYKAPLMSLLPGKRAEAITTNANSMGDRLDEFEQKWANAAPSAAYLTQMPGISAEAKQARAALDPRYKARLSTQGDGAAPAAPAAPGAAPAAPAAAPQKPQGAPPGMPQSAIDQIVKANGGVADFGNRGKYRYVNGKIEQVPNG